MEFILLAYSAFCATLAGLREASKDKVENFFTYMNWISYFIL